MSKSRRKSIQNAQERLEPISKTIMSTKVSKIHKQDKTIMSTKSTRKERSIGLLSSNQWTWMIYLWSCKCMKILRALLKSCIIFFLIIGHLVKIFCELWHLPQNPILVNIVIIFQMLHYNLAVLLKPLIPPIIIWKEIIKDC